MTETQVWLITGVSTGLGEQIQRAAAQSGALAVGTVRNESQIAEVEQRVPGKTFAVVLDVNDERSIAEAIQEVESRFGVVHVLVNNAGYGLVGAVEETTMDEARAQMETNFFGALGVTRAVIPLMRRRGYGRILQISSIAGIVGAPGLGLYDASKHALEGMSEALYHELKPLNIHVTIVEPGPFRTNWAGASMRHVRQHLEVYAASAGAMKEKLSDLNGQQPGDPVRAAEALVRLSRVEKPPLRFPLGGRAVDAISNKLAQVRQDMERWKAEALSADFPDERVG